MVISQATFQAQHDPRHRMEVLREQLEGDLMRRELVAASARQFPWSFNGGFLNRANTWDLPSGNLT